MNKIKVAVIMGGKSSEHEISILSGQQVLANLDPNKYEALPVVISKTGNWLVASERDILNLDDPIKLKGSTKEIILSNRDEIDGPKNLMSRDIDVVFIAMHGSFGEDGRIQGMLDLSGIKYTGSGVLSSALGMDKDIFRKVMIANNLPIPKYVAIDKTEDMRIISKTVGKLPYFVKPVNGGSSIGSSIVKKENDLRMALENAFKYDTKVLIDEYIKGIEVTCSVIEKETAISLPVIQIKPLKGEFFDYKSKYTESGSEEIVPAKISPELTKEIQDLSIKVFKAINCKGFARVDFILRDNTEPIILEINTIPGLTQMSLLPKSAKAAGISYSELLDIIINNAIN